jgi:ATP-binding cassette subfamily B protein
MVFSELAFPASLYVSLELAVIVNFRIYEWLLLQARPLMKKHIGTVLMDHMMGQSHGVFQHHFAGNLTTKISDIATGIPDILKIVVDKFYCHTVMLCVSIFTIARIEGKFGIGLAVWVAFFVAISAATFSKAKRLCKQSDEKRSGVIANTVDILSNMMSVRLFCGRQGERKFLGEIWDEAVASDQKKAWFFLTMLGIQALSYMVFQAMCLWWLISGVGAGVVTAGDFALVISVNVSVFGCLWSLSRDMRDFAENLGNVAQGLKLILLAHEIQDTAAAKPLVVTKGEIVFDRVCFRYQGAEPVFSEKSVRISSGQKVGLVGHSGSGKTTFVNLILRLFDVTSGRILIDGVDVREVTQESLRSVIAMIPQDPSLFNRSLLENIRYGKGDATDAEVIAAARSAHAHEFIAALPQGYHTLAGERGVKLSGGQRQRIAIARAILKNAPLLILDEATSQLDSVTESLIQKSMWSLMQGKTAIVIAHRLSTLLTMDRILVFDKGKIVQEGSHYQLLAEHGLYRTLWNAQVGGFLPEDFFLPNGIVLPSPTGAHVVEGSNGAALGQSTAGDMSSDLASPHFAVRPELSSSVCSQSDP